MPMITAGQAKVLNANHRRVQFTGVTTAGMAAGQLFKFRGESLLFVVGSVIASNEIELTADYNGARAFDVFHNYSVTVDFTPTLGLPELSSADVDIRDIYTYAMRLLDQAAGKAMLGADPTGTEGTLGEIVFDETPSPGGYVGWVCTTSGAAGVAVWKRFGAIEA
jgi:hypothetical protein